jgi:alkyl hydroperoxide reductase subunit AhpC
MVRTLPRPAEQGMLLCILDLSVGSCASATRTPELDRLHEDFRAKGVEMIAVSGDTQERALEAKQKWGLESVPIGYGLEVEKMREWGLFVSGGDGDEEPELYGEPGLFLIRPDETVYYEAINSMPFGRPQLGEMLTALDNIKKMDIPAHGEA